jgi:ATP-dependent exoDNAse (exonuclease V) alpha subunit
VAQDLAKDGFTEAAARQAGAKVILAGDDRQQASIERGGLFTELKQRHDTAEISTVTRQRVDWQRQAAHDPAEGRLRPSQPWELCSHCPRRPIARSPQG